MINESGVYFFSGGGHNHDGENSSLINTDSYSLFDFNFGFQGGPNRVYRQSLNLDGFKQLIINTVNDSVLAPAGIVLQPGVINGNSHIISRSITANEISANSITANEIAANTITADELSANIVLINNIIQSNNYVANVSGWAIHGNGFAEFDIAVIRGQIQADSIYINSNNYWLSNGIFSVGDGVDSLFFNGSDLVLTGTIVTSNITATGGTIADLIINPEHLRLGGTFLGTMDIGNLDSAANITTTESTEAAGIYLVGPEAGFTGNKSVYTWEKIEFFDGNAPDGSSCVGCNPTGYKLAVWKNGIQYDAANYTDRIEFWYDSVADELFAYINHANGVTTEYCIQSCGVTPVPSPTPSPTPSGSPTPSPTPTPSGSPTPSPTPTVTYAFATFCDSGSCVQIGGQSAGFTDCPSLTAFIYANFNNISNYSCQLGSFPACPSCSAPAPTPVAPTPTAPTPTAPTPTAPTPTAPTPTAPTPVAPTPTAPPVCTPPCPEGFTCVYEPDGCIG